MKRLLLLALMIGSFCVAPAAYSRIFSNSFLEFELPDAWTCDLRETEWVCVDSRETGPRSSIIIFTAKYRGAEDRFDLYEDHLSTPRQLMDHEGRPLGRTSRIELVRQVTIAGRIWIHGRHFESEVPGFLTDYFATVDDRVAVLVTFSAHRSVYDTMFARFYPSMASIRPR